MILELQRNKQMTEKHPYESAEIKQLHKLPYGGLQEGDYGGRIHVIAELQHDNLFLIVDKSLKTIDVATGSEASDDYIINKSINKNISDKKRKELQEDTVGGQ